MLKLFNFFFGGGGGGGFEYRLRVYKGLKKGGIIRGRKIKGF